MTNINAETLSVNGVEYVRKDTNQGYNFNGDTKIVVLQRGWVMVGKFERNGYGYGNGDGTGAGW